MKYHLKAFGKVSLLISSLCSKCRFLKKSYLFSDETRQISQCICGVIDSIDSDLNEDYEERLKFYTDCRGQFKRLEYVQWRLTHKSLSLATSILIRSNQRQNSSNRVRGFFQVRT